MSAYSIQNVSDDLSGILHGKTGKRITNFFGVCRRAASNLITHIDPDETRMYAPITLYDGVDDYALPMNDLKEKAIFDVRPQIRRRRRDNLSLRFSKEFDQKKWDNWFTIEDADGTKWIRVSKRLDPAKSSVDPMDGSTTWTLSGGATNLVVDNLYSVSDSGSSLRIDLSGSSPGFLTNVSDAFTVAASTLSDWVSAASFFLWVYQPKSATDITTVKLRIGSDANNYYEMTGVIHFGSQQQGWNLFRFDWVNATKVGNPNSTSLSYARVELDYPTPVLGVRLNNLFASLPKIWEIGYYSKFLFNNAGTWQDTVADYSTTINLDTASYNLYLYEVALEASQQVMGKDALADRKAIYDKLYTGVGDVPSLYQSYMNNNPAQREKTTQTYYTGLRYKRK